MSPSLPFTLAAVLLVGTQAVAGQTGPGPRNAHGLAYDRSSGTLVLFGGATATEVRDDTWLWKDGAWRPGPAKGPPPRTFPAMTYDSARAEVILFGGNRVLFGDSLHRPAVLGDTWIWRHGGWTLAAEDGPAPRAEAAIAYDPRRRRVVLFGGYGYVREVRTRLGDTWEWDGKRWSRVSRTGPRPRSGAAMAYDPDIGAVVLFGGSGGPLGDTWAWNGTSWRRLPVGVAPGRFNAAMTWDPGSRVLVRFGGWDGKRRPGGTWELRGSAWVETVGAGPAGRNHTVMVGLSDRGSVVLYGGHDGEHVFGDLWERRAGEWVRLETIAPALRVENGH
jgi:hypothetical protein